jgi:ABC-type multidrug transport system fused ATPase/permease subunit
MNGGGQEELASSSSSSSEAQAEASASARARLLSHYAASSSNGNGRSSHDPHHLHPQQLMPDHHSPHTSMDDQPGSLESQATLSDDSDSESAARGVRVDLKDVTFGYHPDRQVLKGVTLTAASGKSLAVVGSSGSGKSTILKLVTRLYDVRGGAVEVNGLDVREVMRDSLRSAVAVVPQDTVLFNDTILNNIRWVRGGRGVAVRGCVTGEALCTGRGPAPVACFHGADLPDLLMTRSSDEFPCVWQEGTLLAASPC